MRVETATTRDKYIPVDIETMIHVYLIDEFEIGESVG